MLSGVEGKILSFPYYVCLKLSLSEKFEIDNKKFDDDIQYLCFAMVSMISLYFRLGLGLFRNS